MNYHNLTYPDMNNGDGLRVALWLSGCNHCCHNCQNPQTWDANSGILFDEEAKEELFRELDKDYISGLTLTGGDPLAEKNLDGVLDLVKEVNEINISYGRKKTIWVYTGYTWEDIFDTNHLKKDEKEFLVCHKRAEIVTKCDVLVDGRYIDSLRDPSLKWRGSSNQRVIDIQESLKQNKVKQNKVKQNKVVLYCD